MKTILLIISIAVFTLSGCKKAVNIYSDDVNHSINTQAVALQTIFSLVSLQHKTALSSGNAIANSCTTRTADTIAGIVSDATVIYTGNCYENDSYSSGSFSSAYPLTYPNLNQEVHLHIDSLKSNGKTFSGEIIFYKSSPFKIKISTLNLTITDFRGATDVAIDLEMNLSLNNAITGEIKGSGTNNFVWKTVNQIYGASTVEYLGPQQPIFLFGEASFISNGMTLKENFGNGEEDNLAVFSEKNDERKILKLPKF